MLNIAMAQIKVTPGHPDQNTQRMLKMIADAKAQHVDVIIFPEMCIPGYLLGDTWEQPAFLRDCESYGADIINASSNIVVLFGNVAIDWKKKNNDGRVRKYNALFCAQNGRLIAPDNMPYPFIIKALMPNYREFDDTRHFFSLQKLAREIGTTAERLLSPLTLDIKGERYRIGGLLCEDGWSDDYSLTPIAELNRHHDIDFFVNISASPYTLGKNEKRNRVFGAEAKSAHTPLFYVNNIGLQNNGKTIYTFDGSSTVYSASGHAVRVCPAYEEALCCTELNHIDAMQEIEHSPTPDIAHIYQALTYGIREFLSGIRMEKVIIGISGGIDSAVAAALYAKIVAPENLLLINMPSVFNSQTTRGLSQKLAENIGCQYMIVPIQGSVDLTKQQLEELPVTDLANGKTYHLEISSFVLENIQARDRSARVLAGAAAAFGGGFTCNANKAETTVGYSTLYGDQSGFLAALADLWKHQVYELASYLNHTVYKRELIPQGIIDIVPSAELSNAQNVDEGKGDPLRYPYHDYLFRSFIECWQKATPEDLLLWYTEGTVEKHLGCAPGLVEKYFPTPQAFIEDLERWWNLFTGMAIAKRIQAPPILAVSRRAYGFDHREAQDGPYYTRNYRKLKAKLLSLPLDKTEN